MSSNRRRHTRVRARGVAAHLRTERGRTACQVENVSLGGLFVRTDQLEEVGAEIVVDLVKPGWKRQLSINARITSRVDSLDGQLARRMPGMGLQFLRLDEKQHDRLQSLLRELGASDEDLEVTLPDESAEEELRALELRELDLEAVSAETAAPLDLQPQPLWKQKPPKAAPTEPQKIAPAAGEPGRDGAGAADTARLMLQIRGLVMQLSETQQQLFQREQEIERLKSDLETLRAALESSVRNA